MILPLSLGALVSREVAPGARQLGVMVRHIIYNYYNIFTDAQADAEVSSLSDAPPGSEHDVKAVNNEDLSIEVAEERLKNAATLMTDKLCQG